MVAKSIYYKIWVAEFIYRDPYVIAEFLSLFKL